MQRWWEFWTQYTLLPKTWTWSILGDTIHTLLPSSLLRHLGLFLAVIQEPQYVHCLCMADLELLGRPRIFMEDAEFAGYEAVVGWAELSTDSARWGP